MSKSFECDMGVNGRDTDAEYVVAPAPLAVAFDVQIKIGSAWVFPVPLSVSHEPCIAVPAGPHSSACLVAIVVVVVVASAAACFVVVVVASAAAHFVVVVVAPVVDSAVDAVGVAEFESTITAQCST